MIDFAPRFVHRMQARFRDFLNLANKKIGVRPFRLPQTMAHELEDMPWGPSVPQLIPTETELQLLHILRQELTYELGPQEIDDCDVLRFALQELQLKIRNSDREDLLLRLRFHLWDVNGNDA